MNDSKALRMMIYASLFAALTAVSAVMAIHIGPVPVILHNLFVMLAGLLLGKNWGFASVAVYFLAGSAGLPVFASGSGGIGYLLGPKGGYIVGFLPAVYVIGTVSEIKQGHWLFDLGAMICGSIIIYICGAVWLKRVMDISLAESLVIGVYPFIIFDSLKIAAALPIAKALRPVINKNYENNRN